MSPAVILSIIGAYLVGGIPFGLILSVVAGRGDIRTQGSGNIGATNVYRSGGRWLGILTLALDIGKGATIVWLSARVLDAPAWEAVAAFAAVVGHCHPIYLGFRGGKGVATGCGAYAVLAPLPMGITLLVFGALLLGTRMVSVGSMGAAIALPALIAWLSPEPWLIMSVIASVLLVIARHRENIMRIVGGKESKVDGG